MVETNFVGCSKGLDQVIDGSVSAQDSAGTFPHRRSRREASPCTGFRRGRRRPRLRRARCRHRARRGTGERCHRVGERPEQPVVRRRPLSDADRQQPAGRDRDHGRHRTQGLPAGLHPGPQRRRLQPDMGRYQCGVLRHRGRRGDLRDPGQGRRRLGLHRRLRRHQTRPGLCRRGLHGGRLPAGDHQVPAARDRLRPGGAGVREHRGRRARDRRGQDPAAEQPGPVRVGDHRGHRGRHRLVRPADAQRGEVAGLHAQQLLHHALRRRLQRRRLADRRADRLQRPAQDHLRLGHRHRVRPRGLLRHERPQRLGRVLLPGGLPDRAGLRDQPRHGPIHLLVAQPGPPVQPAGQRHDIRCVQQCAAGQLGLRQVLGEVRRRHPAQHPAAHHPADHGRQHRRRHLHGRRVERVRGVRGRQRGGPQQPQVEGQVVDHQRGARHHR
ncbi:hypothetical protein SBRY_70130 [Actinacidiphila bryophytorum]|uniref:Uncharacterized protein n=1 Tax=Actinacidiphila bryophytorum TaxID=1436133 RepID=A0A9W4H740_9ACTN|nr:hypothetical protein SBRY_70130 [Actinacidiphila bryophytorum]